MNDPYRKALVAAKAILGAGVPTNRAQRRKAERQQRQITTGLRHREKKEP